MADTDEALAGLRLLEAQLEESMRAVQEQLVATRVKIALVEARRATRTSEREPGRPGPSTNPLATPTGPRMRGRGARLMLETLARQGEAGMSGRELKEKFLAEGLSLDTSEKVKAQLKRAGAVGHDRALQHWFAAGVGPAYVEEDRRARAAAHEQTRDPKA